MKIIHIIPSLSVGGLQKVALSLCHALALKGNSVTLVSLKSFDIDSPMLQGMPDDIRLISLGHAKRRVDARLFWSIFSLLSKEKPQICHTHGIAIMYCMFAVLIPGVKFVHTVHNMANHDGGILRRRLQKYIFILGNVAVVSLSRTITDTIKKFYRMNPAAEIENGAEALSVSADFDAVKSMINQCAKDNATITLLSIGRLGDHKNQKLFVRAIKELCNENYNVVGLIVGGDPTSDHTYKTELEYLSEGYPIYLLGERANVGDFMAIADAFCLTSTFEGFPIVVLEAMSMGLPIIATPAGGVKDIMNDPGIGLLTKGMSVSEYALCLKTFIKHRMRFDSVYIKSVFDMKYTRHHFCTKYEKLYITLTSSST